MRVGYGESIFMHTISLLCAYGKTVTQIYCVLLNYLIERDYYVDNI